MRQSTRKTKNFRMSPKAG